MAENYVKILSIRILWITRKTEGCLAFANYIKLNNLFCLQLSTFWENHGVHRCKKLDIKPCSQTENETEPRPYLVGDTDSRSVTISKQPRDWLVLARVTGCECRVLLEILLSLAVGQDEVFHILPLLPRYLEPCAEGFNAVKSIRDT